MNATAATADAKTDPRHLWARVLGAVAAILLLSSLALPYWQVRLFAPQYRNGLTATMYAYKVTGDVQEIDGLNHYVGVTKLENLATLERASAIPAVVVMAVFCLLAFPRGCRLTRLALAGPTALFPWIFVTDMAFWMHHAATHLDPTAPLKLKPFSIPILGAGKVGQFRSEVWPQWGFLLAVAAALIMIEALWLAWSHSGCPNDGPKTCRFHGICPLKPAVVLLLALSLAPPARAADLKELVDQAVPGAVIELPPGNYHGPLSIAKPLTLRGGGKAVIDGRGLGTLVTIKAPGVTLDGLILQDSGERLLYEDSAVRIEAPDAVVRGCRMNDVLFGVFLVHAPRALIEDNFMSGKAVDMGRRGDLLRSWNSDKVIVRRNDFEGGRDAVLWFSTGSIIEANTMRDGRYGLHFMYTDNAVVKGNVFKDNSVGLYVMYSKGLRIEGNTFENHRGPSGAGLGLKESDSISVTQNLFLGNRQGIYIDGSPLIEENANVFSGNRLAYNDIGISVLPGVKGNSFFNNAFVDNLQQVSLRGGGQLRGNTWSNEGRGNFWSDYAGYGVAGAAVGKLSYKQDSAWENLMDREPVARFFLFTPAAQAVELAGRAFPVFRPKPVLTDEFPLLAQPQGIPAMPPQAVQAGMELPVGLLSVSGLLLWLPKFRRRRAAAAPTPDAGVPALEAVGVSKSFAGQSVLSGLGVRIEAGRTVVLWGGNGAGKSTFIKCLLGLHDFEGGIRVFGRDARSEGEKARAFVGYVAQEFAGYDWSVAEAMEFMADLRGVSHERIGPVLSRCGLAGSEDKTVPQLSGGMKQKLALSQALLADPALLVLDEPCSSLDPKSRAEFLHVLQGLKGTRTILMTSHRVEETEALADEVVWLEEGRPPRHLSREEFSREVGIGRPLWVELENGALRPRAVEALTRAGFSASLNGLGIWVDAEPGKVEAMLRAMSAAGIAVRDLRREVSA
jgi:nitrous oxidase accessory protein